MSIKLVASDLDGTLVDHNNFIPAKNLDAIKSMHNKNVDFAICTGKTYSITKDICSKCNASYGIFGNGTLIVDLNTGKEIYKNLVSIEDFNSCYNIAKEHNLHIHIYTDTEIITEFLMYMDLRNYILNGSKDTENLHFKIVPNIKEYVNTNNSQIFKLVISSDESLDNVKDILIKNIPLTINHIKKKKQYKDMIINKEYEYLDITPKNIGKGYALNYLSNFLHVDTNDIMAIGDNVNDIDMLKNSGIGVTLSDAYDEIKKVATYTTTNTVANSGFAEAIYKFVT